MEKPVRQTEITQFQKGKPKSTLDLLVTEEPLEIRVKFHDGIDFREKRLAVTMRTPGNDFELAMGFLYTEGLISSASDVTKIFYCQEVKNEREEGNVVIIHLDEKVSLDESVFNRNFYVNSSCGVCGKSSIESIETVCKADFSGNDLKVSADFIAGIPDVVSKDQSVFKFTGGLHASALLSDKGEVLILREDIGRHNALDKLIGAALASGTNNSDKVLFVSGRAGFELVQKSVVAGIPVMVAVGAPSSLAVDLARKYDMTLVGFNRQGRFNLYSGTARIIN